MLEFYATNLYYFHFIRTVLLYSFICMQILIKFYPENKKLSEINIELHATNIDADAWW